MDIFSEFEVFNDRPNYEQFKKQLPELIRDGKIGEFRFELKKNGWDDMDITMVDFIYRMSTGGDIETDFEAFSVCVTLKSLFPEKTESIEYIMQDLIENTDNRAKYTDLFDMVPESPLIMPLLAYMS